MIPAEKLDQISGMLDRHANVAIIKVQKNLRDGSTTTLEEYVLIEPEETRAASWKEAAMLKLADIVDGYAAPEGVSVFRLRAYADTKCALYLEGCTIRVEPSEALERSAPMAVAQSAGREHDDTFYNSRARAQVDLSIRMANDAVSLYGAMAGQAMSWVNEARQEVKTANAELIRQNKDLMEHQLKGKIAESGLEAEKAKTELTRELGSGILDTAGLALSALAGEEPIPSGARRALRALTKNPRLMAALEDPDTIRALEHPDIQNQLAEMVGEIGPSLRATTPTPSAEAPRV